MKCNTSRLQNIELLRGILMLMIVGLHVLGHNILRPDNGYEISSINSIIAVVWFSCSVMAVNCFIIISGYFGIRPTYRKFFKLILPIIFYSVIIYLLISLFNHNFTVKGLIRSCFPISSGGYWFVAAYVGLFVVAPLLNWIIDKTDIKYLTGGLIIGYLLFVIYPSFTPFSLTNGDRGHGIVSFALLYMTGGFLHKIKPSKGLLIYFLSIIILSLGNMWEYLYNPLIGYKTHFNNYDNLFVYTAALGLFIFFLSIKVKLSFIWYLSPSFFYVYVIHENNSMRQVLYKWLGCTDVLDSPYWLLQSLGNTFLIFLSCLAIDIIRRLLLGNLFERTVESIVNITEKNIRRLSMFVLTIKH